ncbi:MAG: hypothetical protein HN366_05505 [Deltaproteobacteria bacterium]|jgi:hypothetical protein|nr:hypothetical protein [Deltaproteobacteria bacterium]
MKEKTRNKNHPSNPVFAICTAVGMALLILWLYRSALNGWWRWDDTVHLKQAFCQTPLEYFFSPDAYQFLSLKNFTPWLIFSFDMDLHFLGLDPARFYARQLMDLWLAGVVSYFLLRLWLPAWWAALGGALCIIGAPAATTVQQLMTRHYVEGLLFALLALYLFLVSVREKRRLTPLLGAAFYLLAMASKEVFVPLAVLFLLWPEGSLRNRLFASIPYFSALLLYILWREFMIGMMGGGYRIHWDTLLLFPMKVCHSFFGTSHFSLMVGIMAAAVLLLSLLKKTPNRMFGRMLFAAALTCAAIGPLIPLGPAVSAERYFLVPWCVFSMALAVVLGSRQLHKRSPLVLNLLIFCLVALAALIHGHKGVRAMDPIIERFDAQGRFLWQSQKPRAVLYAPVTSHFGHYFSGLQWVKAHTKGTSQTFMVMGDEIELKALGDRPEDIWAYDAKSRSVRDISTRIPGILEPWQKKQRLMPLSFRLDYGKDKTAVWQCGPYPSGAYTFLSRDDTLVDGSLETSGMNKFPLSPSGQWRVNLEKPLFFYLRYDSPLGWTTYSPLLYFDPGDEHFQWNRGNSSKASNTTNNTTE